MKFILLALAVFVSAAVADVAFVSPVIPNMNEHTCTQVDLTKDANGGAIAASYSSPTASAQCWFYPTTACAQADATTSFPDTPDTSLNVFVQCAMTYQMQLIFTQGNTLSATSDEFIVKGESGAGMCGDPRVYPFQGDSFLFNGAYNVYYQLFSSAFLQLNTKFITANGPAGPNGKHSTINSAFGLIIGSATYEADISGYTPAGTDASGNPTPASMTYTLNGVSESATVGTPVTYGCVTVALDASEMHARHHHHVLSFVGPMFEIYVYLSEDHTKYIDGSYFDYYVRADATGTVGGVLGATAGTYTAKQVNDQEAQYRIAPTSNNGDPLGYTDPIIFQAQPVCANKKQVTCKNLPDGHKCTASNQCASNHCNFNKHVCTPYGYCFNSVDCTTTTTCGASHQCVTF